MASRLLHLAVAECVFPALENTDCRRFRLGMILPDAADRSGKVATHLKLKAKGMKTYDLELFREKFASELTGDGLYLGYYLHLVSDLVFRRILYSEHRWIPDSSEKVARLYGDYRMINGYVISRYGIKNDVSVPADFAEERINELYPFRNTVCDFIRETAGDFDAVSAGEYYFFTPDIADDFVRRAAALCVKEYEALLCGRTVLTQSDYNFSEP